MAFSCQTVFRLLPALALFAVCLAGMPQAAHASAEMRKELAKIAQSVQQILAAEGKTEVSVGQFTGPSTFPATGGPGITQMMTEELTKLGLRVTTPADVGIEGKFLFTEIEQPDPNNARATQKLTALRIKGNLVDRFGRQLTAFNLDTRIADGEFKADVKSDEAVAKSLGLTGNLPADGTAEERAAALRGQLENPTCHVVGGTKLCPSADSPFSLEIVCDQTLVPFEARNGLAHCDIPIKTAYAIRIGNNSESDCAVRIAIDGLSVFAFSDLRHADGPKKGEPLYDCHIVKAKSVAQISGWHRTNDRVEAFLVTEPAKAAALAIQRQFQQAKLGTITAQFFAAWPADQSPPADEPPLRKGTPRATGRGAPLNQVVTEVQRNIGVLRSTIALRYDK